MMQKLCSSFICPNDIIMGRSDKAPPEGEIFDNRLTRRVSHIRRLTEEFWRKWSQSYYLTLVKYQRWKLKQRNAEPGDVVLILDKEGPKGKFSLGLISSVKTDPDDVVRKVTVKYKLGQSGLNHNLVPSPFKYTERNVRNLALVVTAQEAKEVEEINLDEIRFNNRKENDEEINDVENNEGEHDVFRQASNEENIQQNDELIPSENDDNDEAPNNAAQSEPDGFASPGEDERNTDEAKVNERKAREIPMSSTGRIRWKPDKLDL